MFGDFGVLVLTCIVKSASGQWHHKARAFASFCCMVN